MQACLLKRKLHMPMRHHHCHQVWLHDCKGLKVIKLRVPGGFRVHFSSNDPLTLHDLCAGHILIQYWPRIYNDLFAELIDP